MLLESLSHIKKIDAQILIIMKPAQEINIKFLGTKAFFGNLLSVDFNYLLMGIIVLRLLLSKVFNATEH